MSLPEHWSVSRQNTVYKCGEQYRRRYVMGERRPPGVAMIRGKGVDKSVNANLLAKMTTGALLERDAALAVGSDYVDRARGSGEFLVDGDYEGMSDGVAFGAIKDEVTALSAKHFDDVAPTLEPTAIQPRYRVPAGSSLPVPFINIPDIVDRGKHLIDVKTKRKSPPVDAADLSDQLTGQVLAHAARTGTPVGEITASLHNLIRTPKRLDVKFVPQTTTRTTAHLVTFVARANAALEMIDAEVYLPAPTDSWQCSEKWCGFWGTCPFAQRGVKRPTT